MPVGFRRTLPAALALLFPAAALAQKSPLTLPDSRKLIEAGVAAHDSGAYQRAIALYRQVPEGDTNYTWALNESIVTLLADSGHAAEARDLALQGLRLPDANKREMLLNLGHAYDYLGRADSALALYDSVARLNPYDHQPVFEKAMVWYRKEDYARAQALLQQSAMLNPYHFRTHNMLGRTYALQGRLGEAWLAFTTSLYCSNQPEVAQLSVGPLIQIRNNTDEVAAAYAKKDTRYAHPMWDEIDELLNAKLALSSEYKFKSELLGDGIANTTHAVLEKLRYEPGDTNFAMQYYVPLYSTLYRDGNFDPMMFLLYSDAGSEKIDRLAKTHRSELGKVRETVSNYMDRIAGTGILNLQKRKAAEPTRTLVPSEHILVVGRVRSVSPLEMGEGMTQLYRNGILRAEGRYDADGKKHGLWKQYSPVGARNLEEHYNHGVEEGERVEYWSNGAVRRRVRMKNGEPVTEDEFAYSGAPTTHSTANGPDGITEVNNLHPNGRLEGTLRLRNNKMLDGVVKTYGDRGQVTQQLTIKDGEKNGPYTRWYGDGTKREEGTYKDGERDGLVTTYHQNGVHASEVTYRRDKAQGTMREWDTDGKLTEETEFENGDQVQSSYYTPDGYKYGVVGYRSGAPRSYRYTRAGGQVIAASGSGIPDTVSFYYPNGERRSAVPYRNGKAHGLASYYTTAGQLDATTQYKDGQRHGLSTNYFSNGRKHSEYTWADGEQTGPFRYWDERGTLRADGWMVDGKRQGVLHNYDATGALTDDRYYNLDLANGPQRAYNRGGRLRYIDYYDADVLTERALFDTAGRRVEQTQYPLGNGMYRLAAGGKTYFEAPLRYGLYEGQTRNLLPDGTVTYEGYFRNGKRDSVYQQFYPTGQRSGRGQFRDGEEEGLWESWDEIGQPLRQTHWKAGQRNGEEKSYTGGTLRFKTMMANGEKHGEQVVYGGPDAVACVLYWRDGLLTGYALPAPSGGLQPMVAVERGNADIEGQFPNGKPSVKLHYRAGKLHGHQEWFYANGNRAEVSDWSWGNLEGDVQKWYPTGQLFYSVRMINDNEEGLERTYGPDGTLLSEIPNVMGTPHGAARYRVPATKKDKSVVFHYGSAVSVR